MYHFQGIFIINKDADERRMIKKIKKAFNNILKIETTGIKTLAYELKGEKKANILLSIL